MMIFSLLLICAVGGYVRGAGILGSLRTDNDPSLSINRLQKDTQPLALKLTLDGFEDDSQSGQIADQTPLTQPEEGNAQAHEVPANVTEVDRTWPEGDTEKSGGNEGRVNDELMPGFGEDQPEKKQTKRQFYLPPPLQYSQVSQSQYPFVPIYIPYPQVVEVHRVVMLQSPTCLPGQQPYQPGQQPFQPGQQPFQPGQRPFQPGQQPFQPGQQPFQPDLPPYMPFPPTSPDQPTNNTGLDDRQGPMGGMNTTNVPAKPSRCVWAIVACCSPDSITIRYSCFELLGCPGAFWGVNPCTTQVVQAAANTALNFYMSGGTDENNVNSNIL